MAYKEMETEKIIGLLRDRAMVGRMMVQDKLLMLEAADRLEDLTQDVDEWIAVFDMLNDRENRHGYLNWWREKNGKNELCYPDGDEVYKDFFAMKARVEQYERVCGKLAIRDGEVVGITVGKEVEYISKDIARVQKNLAVNTAKTEVAREIMKEVRQALLNMVLANAMGESYDIEKCFDEIEKKYKEENQ